MAKTKIVKSIKPDLNLSKRTIQLIIIGVILIIVIILFAIFFPREKYNDSKNNVNESFMGIEMLNDPSVKDYTDSNQEDDLNTLKNSTKKSFIMFYAPWCGHCKSSMPAYQRIIDSYKNDPNITVFKVNCDDNKDIAREHNIEGYPTIRLYPSGMKNKNKYLDYDGERTFEEMNSYIKQS